MMFDPVLCCGRLSIASTLPHLAYCAAYLERVVYTAPRHDGLEESECMSVISIMRQDLHETMEQGDKQGSP